MEIRLVRYPKGVINVGHTHPCAHGMQVLDGNLVTHKGVYGSGTFVWFPEGEVMELGASTETDVTVQFITNKPFRIDCVHNERMRRKRPNVIIGQNVAASRQSHVMHETT